MIEKLRAKFIRIAMLSVLLVMTLMGVSINALNFLSTNADLNATLQMISSNQGKMPQFRPDKPASTARDDADGIQDRPGRGGPFTAETPFSTRYFVLRYTGKTLDNADMGHIAAVTTEDADIYLAIAVQHGEGYGYTDGYKFCVTNNGGGRYMAVFLDCQQELRSVRIFALVSVVVLVVCVGLVYLLVLFLSRRAMKPVMEGVEKQKQFITDAGHELKTPLTVITTSLQVLEMEVGQQKWIDKIRHQTEKLTDLVNQLVALSRMDEEKPPLQITTFDLSGAVQETVESFQDFALAQGHDLMWDVPAGISYEGDEYALRQLVSILLDNAVKYTDADAPISVRLEGGRKQVTLQTSNACADVDPKTLERLFDRFYRADKARSRQGKGGFGVGLSLARSIAEAHRGSITADCPEPGRIRFTVVLRNGKK